MGYEQPADTPNDTARRSDQRAVVVHTHPVPIRRQRRDSLSIAVSSLPPSHAPQHLEEKVEGIQVTSPWRTVGGADVALQQTGVVDMEAGSGQWRKSSEF